MSAFSRSDARIYQPTEQMEYICHIPNLVQNFFFRKKVLESKANIPKGHSDSWVHTQTDNTTKEKEEKRLKD